MLEAAAKGKCRDHKVRAQWLRRNFSGTSYLQRMSDRLHGILDTRAE